MRKGRGFGVFCGILKKAEIRGEQHGAADGHHIEGQFPDTPVSAHLRG
jgi:hypothetical protein